MKMPSKPILEALTRAVVAVGIMLLAYQVLGVVLQQADLRPSAMFLLMALLAAVVYHFFPKKSQE